MNTTTALAAVFAILSNDELAASITYQEGNEFRSPRQDANLAAYRTELASRVAVAA